MIKIYVLFIVLTCYYSFALGQSKSTLVQQINSIKSQNDIYYWSQFTHPNVDSARINATRWMLEEINTYRANDNQLTTQSLSPYLKHIKIDRGNVKQFFVYIKKTDAALIGTESAPLDASAQMPTTAVTTGHATVTNVTPPVAVVRPFVPDAFVKRIMQAENFTNVYRLLQSMKAQGQILQFGKLRDVDDYSSFSLVVFDIKSQQALTILSPVAHDNMRINLLNGQEDSLDDYPKEMTAVIWYVKK